MTDGSLAHFQLAVITTRVLTGLREGGVPREADRQLETDRQTGREGEEGGERERLGEADSELHGAPVEGAELKVLTVSIPSAPSTSTLSK